MTLIYLLGTDGAGKTTLARRLVAAPLAGQKLRYLYCQVTPALVRPLQWAARALFLRRTDQFKNYDAYRERKQAARGQRPWATRVYCWVWYCDFLLQAWCRLLWARARGGVVIVDRYYLDQVVNQGVLQANDLAGMLRDARMLERLVPRARLHLFLEVTEATAFARKNDIQSPEYLRERNARYRQLGPHYSFLQVDANRPPDAVYEHVRMLLEANPLF